ncbi:MAG: YggT family protein [Rhodoferax sp.]|nr:YggT family protein [Rhodoferax sp.]
MFNQIISLLLQVVFGLVAGACLLRLYLQYQRVTMSARAGNPLGPFIFALTDWLVLPLRRVIPAVGRWDIASLVAAYLLLVVQFALFWLLAGANGSVALIPVLSAFGVAHLALSGLSGLVIIYAVLSWVQTDSPMAGVIARMVMPLLQPIRGVLPLLGGVDLSPLVLLVLLQIAAIVLESLQVALLT